MEFYKNTVKDVPQVPTIGITDLGRLSMDSYRDVTNAFAGQGDSGTEDDPRFVPIMCRKGVTLPELDQAKETLLARARSAFAKKEKMEKLQREMSDYSR